MKKHFSKANRITFAGFAIALIAAAGIFQAVPADGFSQPYIGGYPYTGTTIYHADRVGMTSDFLKLSTGPTQDLLSVLTVAGTNPNFGTNGVGGVNHGFSYQSVAQWDIDGNIYNVGQVWGPDCLVPFCPVVAVWPLTGGEISDPTPEQSVCTQAESVHVAGAMTWKESRTKVSFAHTCLKTDGTVKHHAVEYTRNAYGHPVSDDSQYFMYGTYGPCTQQTCNPQVVDKIKFYQFAIESPEPTSNFSILQYNFWLFDTVDSGIPDRLIRLGNEAARGVNLDSQIGWYITQPTGTAQLITIGGGNTYPNVHVSSKQIDGSLPVGFARFQHDGTTCTGGVCMDDEVQLWNAGSGTVGTVVTTSAQNSPTASDSYEGEKRVVISKDPDTVFAFYYDGSNINYKTSTNGGQTWGSPAALNTGTLVSDSYRWSAVTTIVSGTQYIYVFYWVQGNPDTQNHHFKFHRGVVSSNGQSITWTGPVELGYTLAHSDCGTGGACAAVVTTTDSNGYIYAAFRYKPGGQSNYYYSVKYSTNGGFDWFDSIPHTSIGSTYPPTMALTSLGSGKMIFAYTFYNTNILYFKVYTPGSGWGGTWALTISTWPTAGNKQISADTDPTTGKAYIAFVNSGTSGTLRVARFSASDPDYWETTETADSSMSNHRLPSISITLDGNIHIYTLAGSTTRIYETTKSDSAWGAPVNPFGTSFTAPEQLTASIWWPSAMWREGSSSPYSIKYPFGYN